MQIYTAQDNKFKSRTVLVQASSKEDAMDKGASFLKTTNIRVWKTKNVIDYREQAT